MASYNETVLWSSESGTDVNLTLSGSPTAYDYLRVSYGSPAIPRASATTSFANLGAMWTVDIPSGPTNYLNVYSNFYGGCNTNSASAMYRAVGMWSGISGTTWTNVFNKYGQMTAYSATTNARWNKIYTVVGVKTGDTGYFHRDLIYSRDRDGGTISFKKHPSAYHRIGISFNLSFDQNSATNRSVETYCEYPYSYLANYNHGHMLFQHQFYSSPFSGSQRLNGLALYSGLSGSSWGRVWAMNFTETANSGSLNAANHVITRVVGIDRK